MATRIGYGKIDRTRERDIMADTGKSKGRSNNPGDFGNGNDGSQGVDNTDRAAEERRKRQAAARAQPRRGRSHPYPS
ncbi:MAG: hypothetical protein WB646_18520 [Steroidobacteraceae bacterium]